MSISSLPDWSGRINCHNRNSLQFTNYHSSSIAKNIYLLFFNLNTRNVKSNSANCSSPPILDNDPTPSPVIPNLQDFQISDELPKDSKKMNILICSLFKESHTQQLAYDQFKKAKGMQDFVPQKYTIKLIIRYLIRLKNWDLLLLFFDDLKSFRVLPDSANCCKLIITCIKARKFKIVNTFLELLLSSDVEIAILGFDSAMKGYNQLHMYKSTITLCQKMKSLGLDLDPACYFRIMEAHLKMGSYDKAVHVFQEFENRKLIKVQPSPFYTQIHWILCEALGKMGRSFEALTFFREMASQGIADDHTLYSSLISSFASSGEVKMAEELLEEAEGKKMLRDPALFLKLVLRYVEEGLLEKTLDVVNVMGRVGIRVSDCIFCAIVNGFAKKRGLKLATQVYEDLVARKCEPGQVTYASVLNIYFRLGVYSKAEDVFAQMEKKGYNNCVVAYSSMVAAYGKMGRVTDAVRLVAKMKEKGCEPNVWTYNSLLDMHGRGSNLRLVEKTWKEMKRRRIVPDRVSYTTVISAYNRGKDFETCIKYYQEFKLNGGAIDRALAGIMVAVFSKTNRVGELVELLQDMKMQGTELDARFHKSAMNALRDAGLEVQARWLQESFKFSQV